MIRQKLDIFIWLIYEQLDIHGVNQMIYQKSYTLR